MANTLFSVELEEWRVVPSVPDVEASSHGRIRRRPHVGVMPHGGNRAYLSSPTFGCIRSAKRGASHLYFGYCYRGIGNLKIHRLVCEAFNGPAPFDRAVVIHLNENSLDNRPENLKWGTQRENLNMPRIKGIHSEFARSRFEGRRVMAMNIKLGRECRA